jgi:tRNA (guanine-N7-)-methyltransferase
MCWILAFVSNIINNYFKKVSKGKLEKFAEMKSFSNVLQPPFEEVFNKDFRLKGSWNTGFFKKSQPITLELGCGKGEYSVGLARLYPKRNFLGIDIKGSRIWKGARQAGIENILNVGFLRTRIDFICSFFAPGEVEEIWITFPDPQPLKARKRLTSSRFLNRYKCFLATNGWVNLKTDSSELYEYTSELARHNKLEVDFSTNDLYASGYDNEILSIKTFYENMWLSEGKKIHYIRFNLSGKLTIEEPPDETKG